MKRDKSSRPVSHPSPTTPTLSLPQTPSQMPSQTPSMVSQVITNGAGVALGHIIAHQIIPTASATTSSVTVTKCPELTLFLTCAKENSDLNLCADFIEKLRICV
jgi:hypothetical protein